MSPRRAQSLARHSDIRLTMGVYTHIGLHDQSAAIELLPAPPEIKKSRKGSSNGKVNGSSPAVPDLGAAWAKLPEKVKAEIVAMVNAAAKEARLGTGGCRVTRRIREEDYRFRRQYSPIATAPARIIAHVPGSGTAETA